MDHIIRQRLNEIREKQLASQADPHANTPPTTASDKSHYIATLRGVVAGLTIAIIVWLAKSILTTDDVNIFSTESHDATNAGEISKTKQQIEQLNDRVALLTGAISTLESGLNRVMGTTSPTNVTEMKQYSSRRKDVPETAGVEPRIDVIKHDSPNVADLLPGTDDAFIPTHTVTSRLNFRPSGSLDATPITTLPAGTEVEYIREDDGWYYVNTELHGKGWCAAGYLSPR